MFRNGEIALYHYHSMPKMSSFSIMKDFAVTKNVILELLRLIQFFVQQIG